MESLKCSIQELPRSKPGEPCTSLKLPTLGHQRSLQSLIGEELSSDSVGSLEMGALLMRDEDPDFDGATIKASASETQDEIPAASTTSHMSTEYQQPACLNNHTRSTHETLRRRLLKRRQPMLERPKIVFSYKKRQILREILMFHLLPVAINFTLLGLYAGQFLWAPPGPPTNVSNTLQIAARFHETLMITSLGSVLLHHIRFNLLSSDGRGLPLGLITSPFRLSDISYLWSREFSAGCRALRGSRLSEVIIILIHLFLFILAAVLGPASAISMLPRFGERQITKTVTKAPFYNTQDQNHIYHVYLGGPLSDIFPRRITQIFNPEACDYSRPSQAQTNTCPRTGLADIVKGLMGPQRDYHGLDLTSSARLAYDMTVQADNLESGLPARNISVFPYEVDSIGHPQGNRTFEAFVDVTTSTDAILYLTQTLPGYYLQKWNQRGADPHSSTAAVVREPSPSKFTLYAGLPQSHESSSLWKQPFVSCFCSRHGHEKVSSGPVTFTFKQQAETELYRVTLDSSYLSLVLNDRGMGFLDISQLEVTPDYSPSTAFAFTSPSLTTLCLVKARWIDTSLYGTFSQYLNSGYQISIENLSEVEPAPYAYWGNNGKYWFNNTDGTENIQLDLNWLAVLDHGTGVDETSKYSFLESIRRICLGSSMLDTDNHTGKHPDVICMASGLGSGIAEGLSKVPYKSGIYAVLPVDDAAHEQYNSTLTWSPWMSPVSDTTVSPKFGLPGNYSSSSLSPTQIMANSTRVDFVVTQNLYGYSFSGIMIVISFVVLFLYVATVLVHISVMTFGTSWSSRAWKSLGEFYILALQSPAPTSVLHNTGGGVNVSRTWQARASVRELQDGNRVGIAVRESSHPEAEDDSISKVRPDWKYS